MRVSALHGPKPKRWSLWNRGGGLPVIRASARTPASPDAGYTCSPLRDRAPIGPHGAQRRHLTASDTRYISRSESRLRPWLFLSHFTSLKNFKELPQPHTGRDLQYDNVPRGIPVSAAILNIVSPASMRAFNSARNSGEYISLVVMGRPDIYMGFTPYHDARPGFSAQDFKIVSVITAPLRVSTRARLGSGLGRCPNP